MAKAEKIVKQSGKARIFKEIHELRDNDLGIKINEISPGDFENYIDVYLNLSKESIFHGYPLHARIIFKEDYPFNPPTFVFMSNVYHPNVFENGEMCISILHTENDTALDNEIINCTWTPAWGIRTICLAVISLMDEPNIGSAARVGASLDYRDKRDEYNRKVKEYLDAGR